jgi:Arc/MetJ-type ribon-helix-helix transcriptional regulator
MSTMSTLGVRIPEKQKKRLEKKIQSEGYPNVSEYVRELIRNDLKAEKLDEELAKEILRRKKQIEEGDVELEDMKTMEEIAEEAGLE